MTTITLRERPQVNYQYAVTTVFAADGSVEREIRITKADADKVFAAPSWIPEWGCTRAEYESAFAFPIEERREQLADGRQRLTQVPVGPAVLMSSEQIVSATKAGAKLGQRPRVVCGGKAFLVGDTVLLDDDRVRIKYAETVIAGAITEWWIVLDRREYTGSFPAITCDSINADYAAGQPRVLSILGGVLDHEDAP